MQLSPATHALAHPESNRWLQRLGKLGYAVKGAVYAIMGLLTLAAAVGIGGRLAGEHEAVEHVGRLPFGAAGLVVIGAGLLSYALWRLVEGVMDTHHDGRSWKAIGQRSAAIGSALVNGAVGVAAIQLALGESSEGHDPQTWAALLMRESWGLVVLAVGGAIILIVGLVHVRAGFTDRFTEHLQLSAASPRQREWALWSGRIGFVARGVIFSIIGVALVQAALTTNPREAKGFTEALQHLASQPFGQALLVAVALGLLAYGIHLITTVPYRRLIG